MNVSRQVGITGGIGSGKTFICKIFEVLGINVYYADERARWLQNHDTALIQGIRDAFGDKAYENKQLNRQFLASQVYADPARLAILNKLVHPRVAEDYQQWLAQHQREAYTLKEAALLFETGSYQHLDKVINVNASEAVRTARVLQRDPRRSLEQIKAIMKQQYTNRQRSDLADYTIDNNGDALILPIIVQLHQSLSQL